MSRLEGGADAVAPSPECIDDQVVPWIEGAFEVHRRQTRLELQRIVRHGLVDNTTKCEDCRFAVDRPLCLLDSGDSCQMYFVCKRFSGICRFHWRILANGWLASF
jgi:hypothetical protein